MTKYELEQLKKWAIDSFGSSDTKAYAAIGFFESQFADDPKNAQAHLALAASLNYYGNYLAASSLLIDAMNTAPLDPYPKIKFAEFSVTCPNETFRHAPHALRSAILAMQLADASETFAGRPYERVHFQCVHAAVLAEHGLYSEAESLLRDTIEFAKTARSKGKAKMILGKVLRRQPIYRRGGLEGRDEGPVISCRECGCDIDVEPQQADKLFWIAVVLSISGLFFIVGGLWPSVLTAAFGAVIFSLLARPRRGFTCLRCRFRGFVSLIHR